MAAPAATAGSASPAAARSTAATASGLRSESWTITRSALKRVSADGSSASTRDTAGTTSAAQIPDPHRSHEMPWTAICRTAGTGSARAAANVAVKSSLA